jgi:hypothetical protein
MMNGSGRRAPPVSTLILAGTLALSGGAAAAAEPPLAGCYERVYDAAHLAAHKDQLVVRLTLSITKTQFPDQKGPNAFVADGVLKVWVRARDASFDSIGACRADGNNLACAGSVSAAEATVCRSKPDGLSDCRIALGESGGFRVEGRPEGVLVSIPNRLELLQRPYDGGPYLNLSSGNAENRAFLLNKAACRDAMR